MKDEAHLAQSVVSKPKPGLPSLSPEDLGAAHEVPVGSTVSQVQMTSLDRLTRGGTLKENIVDVLVVSTIISHPLG